MKIANPLYDYAFKYLMSNDKLARKVLSVILEKDVLELELTQQEVVVKDEERRFTMYRLDFKAVIMDNTGRKETVLIELQKSKLPTNVLRFRHYLGLAYMQKTKVKNAETKVEQEGALPIISIYILGYNLEDIPHAAIKVNHKITDMSSREELDLHSDFLDLLNHSCCILQVRRLPEHRRSRIEQFLTLFNQAWVMEEKYILDLQEVPEEFKDIAQYLQRPLAEAEMIAKLQAEEELESIFAQQEAENAYYKREAEEARFREQESRIREEQAVKQKEEERRQKDEERRQKEEERRQKEEERRQKEEERRQKEEALAREHDTAIKLARVLLRTGISVAEVAQETGLTEEEVKSL